MSLSRISTNARRSRLAQSSGHRSGPNGFHKNPQDFQELAGNNFATRQTVLNKNWHYLPRGLRRKAELLSTSYKGVEIEMKSGQFALPLS